MNNTERQLQALERIAAALEQLNAARAWPTLQPAQWHPGQYQCAVCRQWFSGSHICSTYIENWGPVRESSRKSDTGE